MDGIKEYLFGVIAEAILCAIVSQIAGKDSFLGTAVKLITGVFMLLALVSPVMDIRLNPMDIFSDITLQADYITSSAADSSRESMAGIIKDQTQAYILDKAKNHGVELSVEVMLSDDKIPKPISVALRGSVSPYVKKMLTEVIEQDLGIGTEAQIWN